MNNYADVPDNAIDSFFYKLEHRTVNAAKTIKDSRVVRRTISGFFKLLLVMVVFLIVIALYIITDVQESHYYHTRIYGYQNQITDTVIATLESQKIDRTNLV